MPGNAYMQQWIWPSLVQVVIHHLFYALRWRHNGHDSVSNHQPRDCLLSPLIIENIKAPRHWPLCGEFTGDQWIPRTNGQSRGKCFHLMTSSWSSHYCTDTDLVSTGPPKHTWVKFESKHNSFLPRNSIWKYCLQNVVFFFFRSQCVKLKYVINV